MASSEIWSARDQIYRNQRPDSHWLPSFGPKRAHRRCDTGIDMAGEQLSRIFEAFTRLDSMRCDGLGVGLFIVRRAIEVLGHRIDVSSVAPEDHDFPYS